jgi:hypothetical protein
LIGDIKSKNITKNGSNILAFFLMRKSISIFVEKKEEA